MFPRFWALDKLTINNKFSIPITDDNLDELKGAKLFTRLNLYLDYHQICMKEVNISKAIFHTREGH